jgi:hypothetical protein
VVVQHRWWMILIKKKINCFETYLSNFEAFNFRVWIRLQKFTHQ